MQEKESAGEYEVLELTSPGEGSGEGAGEAGEGALRQKKTSRRRSVGGRRMRGSWRRRS